MVNYFEKFDSILLSNSTDNSITFNDVILAYKHGDEDFAASSFIKSYLNEAYTINLTEQKADSIKNFIKSFADNYSLINNIIILKSKTNSIILNRDNISFKINFKKIFPFACRLNGYFDLENSFFSSVYIEATTTFYEKLKDPRTQDEKINHLDFFESLQNAINNINKSLNTYSSSNKFVINKNVSISSSFSQEEKTKYFSLANTFYNDAIKGSNFDIEGKRHTLVINSNSIGVAFIFETIISNRKQAIILYLNNDGSYTTSGFANNVGISCYNKSYEENVKATKESLAFEYYGME